MSPPGQPLDVVAVGLNVVDVLLRKPEAVKAGDKHFVDDLVIQGGAPVGSASAAVARFGYRAAHAVRLGDNTLSAICLDQFHQSGLSTDLVVRDRSSSPAVAFVEIDPRTGERTVFIQMENYGYLQPDDIPVEAIKAARVLLVDSYDLDATERALKAAAGTDCRTVLDLESGDPDRLRGILALGTDAILPLASARILTAEVDPERATQALAGLTQGQAVVTDGANGSWAWKRDNSSIHHQGIFPVTSVDSTGCGDAYHAGYIIGLLEGWDLPLRMEFGALLASVVARKVGGRSALPFRREATSLIRPEVSTELTSNLQALS